MPIELNPRDVEVWVADLDDTRWDRYSGSLSAEERSRAARLRVPLDGERYRRCRGLLRHLLAEYLDRPADRIAFDIGPFGKPGIAADPIRFNVSHSRNIAVLAFARMPIGVDIEFVETDRDHRDLVAQVCTGREAEQPRHYPNATPCGNSMRSGPGRRPI